MPIASGRYEHRAGGIANGITETWRLIAVNKMAVTVTTPSYDLQATVSLSDNHRVQQFTYRVSEIIKGSYAIAGHQLMVERTLPGNTKLHDSLVWPANAILDLPFLSTKGHTILYLDHYGTQPTFAPLLRSGDRAGDLAKKSVERIGKQTIIIGDVTITTTEFRYGHRYWVADNGLVMRAQAADYEMVLVGYNP